MTIDSLSGCRVLVVEDDMLIAMLIEETLQDLGCIVVGPAGKLSVALQLASEEALDVAILDVNIRGGHVYPVADQLIARGIPFVLASGYGDWALPTSLRNQPRLTKPFAGQDLAERVKLLCSTHSVASQSETPRQYL
jgi:DNA-binding response OmpR family regulator